MKKLIGLVLYAALLAGTGAWAQVPATAPGPVPGYVLVYEFYNSVLKQYFRTASAAEASAIDAGSAGPGWARTGDNFYAYIAGSIAPGQDVCRFYSPQANTHFYTASAEECEVLKAPSSGWRYEGLAFRLQLPVLATHCPIVTIPVYRLFNDRALFNDSGHRFTTNFDNVGILEAQGWIYEGVAFCALDLDARIVHPF
jgi:Repeat of unknown function (DUF5648)